MVDVAGSTVGSAIVALAARPGVGCATNLQAWSYLVRRLEGNWRETVGTGFVATGLALPSWVTELKAQSVNQSPGPDIFLSKSQKDQNLSYCTKKYIFLGIKLLLIMSKLDE